MAVISGLLNDESKEYTNKRITLIPIDEIFPNALNHAPINNIDELAASIKETKLQTPLSVYKRANHDYVILNGERRYTALKKLNQYEVPVIVEPKPSSIFEERLIILDANAQRDETKEYKQQRALEYEELYIDLKKQNKILPGILKIDWIGTHMNLSGRQVQRYLQSNQQHGHDVHVNKEVVPGLIKKFDKAIQSIENIETKGLDEQEIKELKESLIQRITILNNLMEKFD